ncbi:MAG TPA: helix-turn-helix domain-containing protein [Acidobacteriaceae bacterium]|nr:helix-turn-helix domain-containing protein [Acidobacteriaceae bacterium]
MKRPKAAPEPESSFMMPLEVAKLLRLSPATVYRQLEAGVIPGIRFGKVWRCRRDRVEALGLPPEE